MDDIFVGQLMSDSVHTVTPGTFVEDAAQLMLDNQIGSVVVVDDEDRLQGILTNTDFVTIVANSKPKARTTVERYMTTDVETTTAQESIRDVADAMLELGFHHMPVVDGDQVIGIITTKDLASYISTVQTPSPA